MNQIRLQLLGISAFLFGIALILAIPDASVVGLVLALLGLAFSLAGASGRKEEK